MPNTALYFPYIRPPASRWTMQTLLYWDRLATIVPMDYPHRDDYFDAPAQQMLAEGLLVAVHPAEYMHEVPAFEQGFLTQMADLLRRPQAQRAGHRIRTCKLHAEKLGALTHQLVDAGLARHSVGPWYEMPVPVANRFMAYLAICLGACRGVDATPVTNQLEMAHLLGGGGPLRGLHRSKARNVILDALLPVPIGPASIDQLLRFKQKHGGLLPRFRMEVEHQCAQIALLEQSEDRLRATQLFITNTKEQIDAISAAMYPAFGQLEFVNLMALCGAGVTLQASEPGFNGAYVGGSLALAAAIGQALQTMRNAGAARRAPLAYAVHARHSFESPLALR